MNVQISVVIKNLNRGGKDKANGTRTVFRNN